MNALRTFALRAAITCIVVGGLCLLTGPVQAQGAPDSVEAIQAAERNRIRAHRELAQSKYAVEEAQCYQVFAVNQCLGRVRNARRDDLADLRRQELVLNSADAKRKAADQLLRADSKASPSAAQSQAAQLANAQAEQQERQRIFDEKAAQRRVPAASAPAAGSSEPIAR